jgi:predicted esterase
MTREDRELAIADNLVYVASALDVVPHDEATRIIYAGFSQGVAMAFRAGVRGHRRAAAVIAAGGDVPRELLEDASLEFPPVLLARGERDDWYTAAKFDADVSALTARRISVQPVTYAGAHEWNASVAALVGEFVASMTRLP